jgi:hypothetical protein
MSVEMTEFDEFDTFDPSPICCICGNSYDVAHFDPKADSDICPDCQDQADKEA